MNACEQGAKLQGNDSCIVTLLQIYENYVHVH